MSAATTPVAATAKVAKRPSPRMAAVRRFLRHRMAVLGLIVIALIVLMAVFAPFITSVDPNRVNMSAGARMPPSAEHVLGTDSSARDVWARVVHGARTSLIVGFTAVTLYIIIGVAIGLAAGFLGGPVDGLLMRFTDTILSIPPLLLMIVFVSIAGPSIGSIIAVIALLLWPPAARLVRGQILVLREAEFTAAARVVGLRDRDIVRKHMLPNILGPLTVVATFGVAEAILLEAALSFLGLGVRPPDSSWGNMILDAENPVILNDVPWMWLPAGIFITVTVLAVNFIGDGLRDAFDPRSSKRG